MNSNRPPVIWDRAVLLLCLLWLGQCQGSSPGNKPQAALVEKTFTRGPLTIRLQIGPARPTLADPIYLSLYVSSLVGTEVRLPDGDQRLGDLVLVDFREEPLQIQGEREIRSQVYQLEALVAGKHLVPSLEIRYRQRSGAGADKETEVRVSTDPMEIEFPGVPAAELQKGLRDIRPVMDLPPNPFPWLMACGMGAALSVSFLFWRSWRKRRLPRETPARPPEEIAREQLHTLWVKDYLTSQRYREFYFELTMIVREYLENRYHLRAPAQTTEEFLQNSLRCEHVTPEIRQQLRSFLEAADVVKYAGSTPTKEEAERSFNTARTFTQ